MQSSTCHDRLGLLAGNELRVPRTNPDVKISFFMSNCHLIRHDRSMSPSLHTCTTVSASLMHWSSLRMYPESHAAVVHRPWVHVIAPNVGRLIDVHHTPRSVSCRPPYLNRNATKIQQWVRCLDELMLGLSRQREGRRNGAYGAKRIGIGTCSSVVTTVSSHERDPVG